MEKIEYEKILLPETILDVDFENGTKGKRELIAAFRAQNENCYFALCPVGENGESQEDVIELVRAVIKDNGEDYALESIDTEEEFELACITFNAVHNSFMEEANAVPDLSFNISLQNENGVLEEYEFIDIFECHGQQYIALIPESEVDDNNITIRLMRFDRVLLDDEANFKVTAIPSEAEYNEALDVFETRLLDT